MISRILKKIKVRNSRPGIINAVRGFADYSKDPDVLSGNNVIYRGNSVYKDDPRRDWGMFHPKHMFDKPPEEGSQEDFGCC